MANKNRGILAVALGLALGNFHQAQQGRAILHNLRNAYRTAGAGKASNAAAQKRASKKRRNIQARASKRA
jgi:hypothetical protein